MAPELRSRLLDDATAHRLREVAAIDPEFVVDDFGRPEAAQALAEAEVLLTFWGAPTVDARALAAAPRLRAVVHAAGSVKQLVTDACWDRGIAVSSAALANSLPVAEYTVAMVLLSNKRVMQLREEYRRVRGSHHEWHLRYGDVGNYRRTVGIVGASRIGRRVIELLRPYDLELRVHDPYLKEDQAQRLGVRAVGLDELCRVSDVVSLHAPELPETRSMIDRRRLALMRDGATLINTARGSLVDGAALTEELVAGRLHGVIDVTEPEVLPADSPLYELPNVLLTPHIAGSLGNELHRMADSAIDEIARYAAGLPFAHPVCRADLHRTA
ncbi:hydroxyacid dehydrogenase [Streptomyces sp. MB09-01]|uniref:hydroxyacid dehydrogenase n=1 Tax=Streptomyces sp. MB09-01 TaxID=3028666 RepID=UPI0029B43CE0|nr:hydroxyacid dehydrogenase [Streptomyces sp. MB09-01]MDX3537415.1 hydroxyacid dehydrogenase [Streptomyces sp. MB09-01]